MTIFEDLESEDLVDCYYEKTARLGFGWDSLEVKGPEVQMKGIMSRDCVFQTLAFGTSNDVTLDGDAFGTYVDVSLA